MSNDQPLTRDEATLVEAHLGLAASIAKGWASRCRGGIEPADIEQAACIGLVEAARRFDPARDSRFAAFASLRIRGAICDFLRAHDPLTRGRRLAVRELDGATRSLESALGRSPSVDELARSLKWETTRVHGAMEDAAALRSGWAQVQDAAPEKIEAQPCPAPDPFAALSAREERQQLSERIAELPEREALILSLHYFEEMQFKEIAVILGVTDSRVSQLHSAALGRLRKSAARELAKAV
jgi:RNA polymerase sigma factor for flagellar operon FliA